MNGNRNTGWRGKAYGLLGVILVMAGFMYLLGNDRVGLWDRDEPRYAQTSKQMLQSSPADWVVPRLLSEVRTAKPVLIYWVQAASMKVLGSTEEFAVRLPSGVAMLLTLTVLAIAIGRTMGWERGLWTAFILSTAGLTIAAAKMCITDSVLLLFIVIAQLCLYAIYAGNRSIWVLIGMWVAIGLAGLTKGPVVIGVQVMTMLALDLPGCGEAVVRGAGVEGCDAVVAAYASVAGNSHRSRHCGAVAGVAAHACAGVLADGVLARRGCADWRSPLEGHKGPPGYYLLTVWGTYFPWCAVAGDGAGDGVEAPGIAVDLIRAGGGDRAVGVDGDRADQAGALRDAGVSGAGVFDGGCVLVRCIRREQDDLHRPLAWKVTAGWALATVAAGFVPWIATKHFLDLPTGVFTVFSIAGIVWASVVLFFFVRRQIAAGAIAMGVGMVMVICIFWAGMLPRLEFLWVPRQVAAILQCEGATYVGDALMLDYDEDSLPYYQGGTIRSPRTLGDERVGWGKWFETPRAKGWRGRC